MGTSPAPPYANLFFAIHENRFVRKYPQLACYKRFIDDIIGIWVPVSNQDDNMKWDEFKKDTNSYYDLKWKFEERTNTINFMDLTITIQDGEISTTLFEKLLNIHGYITPNSAHAPGVLPGLISGNTGRIYSLCSDAAERKRLLASFYHRLLRRGYQPSALLPRFTWARQEADDKSKRTRSG